MKTDLFDDSKIIKKSDNNTEKQVIENNPIKNKPIENNRVQINQKPEETKKVIKENPVFVFQKNNGEVTSTNIIQRTSLNIDIPNDQLKLIYINNKKYINELKVEIEILISFNNKDNYYNNKLDFLKKELEYSIYKNEVLEKLIN